MTGDQNEKEALLETLQDAGCSPDMIEHFMNCCREHQIEEQLRILLKQRCVLLECVHESQKRLDCLDYLIYRLKKCKQKERSL